ncbi:MULTISPECIES: FHA domain-containing protein [Streptomyces]|uniref:FtsK/SpoIIIE domain-containing protein n=2 Tax=Streptomyces TaxID=1883 RepID=A0ABU4K5A9_9ACTN|nr:FHA domain-containing protein [Streptomyces roseolus]MDX2292946.1 FtsK/SpoIIIE domain-containing protein [Streptomyces roseolus]
MQIRLTVLAPHAGHGAGRACDVLVTAPAGTALSAVASNLATAVTGPDATGTGTPVLYAGAERLDARRCVLGEPPLVDGAVLALNAPDPDDRADLAATASSAARLHVVAGPDAGGVHLLHGGAIRVGRSVEADVPLDDPDVSRSHCTVTVAADGRVTVADLGSTNGTILDGAPVGERPVRLRPGALLRLGESTLRLTVPDGAAADPGTLPTAPDGEGHLRVPLPEAAPPAEADAGAWPGHSPGPDADAAAPARTPGPSSSWTGQGPETHGSAQGVPLADAWPDAGHARAREPEGGDGGEPHSRVRTSPGSADPMTRRTGRRGLGAWARRLAGGREAEAAPGAPADPAAPDAARSEAPGPAAAPDTWPDPAAVLLTALGPGPRLWERAADHPEALVVRLGTADRAELSGVPVTVGLREAGSLGLAGPAERLTGLARAVVAQLAALHSPADLEIVLVSADRNRSLEERRRAWGWLGWLPHVRPAHGQDCRLLLAYDREQAQARTAELTRRLDDGPLGPGWASADRSAVAEAAARYAGPATVVVVDGDPGTAALRETVARLAGAGAAAGIHLICLAEAPSASPASPVAATYEAACAASLAFRECGAAALLSGDVATALRLLRTSGGRAAGHGTVGIVDAVSVAWAERFGRALAPLRTDSAAAAPGRAAALPPSARLLDELGLARATPASLMARWASAGEGTAVLGAGPRGPLSVDLTAEGPHLLIEGPAGSGRTELLRAVAASLAAGGRPDRLGLLLVDGAGGERGEGLAACTELPHVTEHLVASDPVRMREFAQALGAELKRRAELLGDADFADRRSTRAVIGQRGASPAEAVPQGVRAGLRLPDASDLGDRPSGRTLRTGAGAVGDSPPGVRTPYQGADDLADRPSGRVPRPAGASDELPSTPSDRLGGRAHVGDLPATFNGRLGGGAADLPTRRSGRTLRTDDPLPAPEDLRATPSARTAHPGAGDVRGATSHRTAHPRASDVQAAASGRTAYPGTEDVTGTSSSRTPYPGASDLSRTPSARTAYPGAGDVQGATSARTASPRAGTASGAGDVQGAASGRTAHPGSSDLSRTPSARTPYPGSGDVHGAGSGRTPYPGSGDGERGAARVPRPASEEDHLPRAAAGRVPLPRLVVLVDDFDALVAPALGAPGRPAAGSVVRALEAVARHGERLGVHLIATSARPDRTVDTDLAHGARLRVVLDAPASAPGPDVPAPGRGRLGHPDGRVTPFQAGRITGRIPRTATLRPTVVPLEWERMGDPPARRPVRELGNGPTDLALLASALDRAARSVEAAPVPPLTHA